MGASDAVALLQLQQQGKQRGYDTLRAFSQNIRMQSLMERFAQANISSPQQFRQFMAQNNVSPGEAQQLLSNVQNTKTAFTPPTQPQPFSSSAQGIFDTRTGEIVNPALPKPTASKGYGSAGGGTIFSKDTGEVVREGFKPLDYYKVNNDGSIVSQKANNSAEAKMFESKGFARGEYKNPSSSGSNAIKTWILPNNKLWHAPSDVKPPEGARPYTEAGELEKRMLISQELTSIRSEKRQIRRELEKARSFPSGVTAFKPYKDRIPVLEEEIEELEARENELLKKGNTFNKQEKSTGPVSYENLSDQERADITARYNQLRKDGKTPDEAFNIVWPSGR